MTKLYTYSKEIWRNLFLLFMPESRLCIIRNLCYTYSRSKRKTFPWSGMAGTLKLLNLVVPLPSPFHPPKRTYFCYLYASNTWTIVVFGCFQKAVAWDMLRVYTDFVEAQERRRWVTYNIRNVRCFKTVWLSHSWLWLEYDDCHMLLLVLEVLC